MVTLAADPGPCPAGWPGEAPGSLGQSVCQTYGTNLSRLGVGGLLPILLVLIMIALDLCVDRSEVTRN